MKQEQRGASTVKQFGNRNNLSPPTVYGEIASGRLRARKVGAKTLIFDEDEEAWRASLPLAPDPAQRIKAINAVKRFRAADCQQDSP